MAVSPPDVFRFLDARAYLKAVYDHRKAHTRSFSYRAFSKRAGLGSPNYLKLVIDGDRNLTAPMALRFGEALDLDGSRLAYFQDLVAFTQAKTTDERTRCYERLIRFREHRELHKIDVAFGQYHAHWYIPAIRELTFRPDCRDDPEWIASRMLPPIRTQQAADAIDLLMDLGMVAREEGRLVPTETLVTTGPEVRGLNYARYHQTMIQRALHALETLPKDQRDISSVTLCLDDTGITRLKDVLQRFRRELLELSADEVDPTQVVQLNLQLFPLSQSESS